jgi:hypothetical protein
LAPDLKPETLARPFLNLVDPPLAILFSDAGAAAFAQQQWKTADESLEGISFQGVNTRSTITPEEALLFVAPSVYVMEAVEHLCDSIKQRDQQQRPAILLNPQLQDAATVGVGLAGRRLRERFLATFEPTYYLRSLGGGALLRVYPHPWTIWQEQEPGQYSILETTSEKPTGEDLAAIFARTAQRSESPFSSLRRFIQALQRQ